MGGAQGLKVRVRRAQRRARAIPDQVQRAARTGTGRFRPLPDFVVIGTQKGGTTSLHDYLASHPRTAPSDIKEVHYFDRDVPLPIEWYRGHFPLRPDGRRVFETTPRYLFHPQAAERMHEALPDAKLIALLRDPVERALSHYRMTARGVREPLGMLEAFEAEEERTAAPRDAARADEDRDWYAYKARGRYAEQLARFYERYDRDQVLVVRSEDLFEDPTGTCRTILDFLGLAVPSDALTFPQSNKTKELDVAPGAREHLERYFEGPNAELADLLGRRFW